MTDLSKLTVAVKISGPQGSGKSTLTRLLMVLFHTFGLKFTITEKQTK